MKEGKIGHPTHTALASARLVRSNAPQGDRQQPLAGPPPSVETEEEAAEQVHAQSPDPKF